MIEYINNPKKNICLNKEYIIMVFPTFQFTSHFLASSTHQLKSAQRVESIHPFIQIVKIWRRHVEITHRESPLLILTMQHQSKVSWFHFLVNCSSLTHASYWMLEGSSALSPRLSGSLWSNGKLKQFCIAVEDPLQNCIGQLCVLAVESKVSTSILLDGWTNIPTHTIADLTTHLSPFLNWLHTA